MANSGANLIKNSTGKYNHYLFNGDGSLIEHKAGWALLRITDDYGYSRTNYYYFNTDNTIRVENWFKSGNNWYYLLSDGTMADQGVHYINNKNYAFDKNGVLLTGWSQPYGYYSGWFYSNANGEGYSNQWLKINGVYYYFDDSGWMKTDSFIVTNGKTYYVNQNGVMITSSKFEDMGRYYEADNNGVITSISKL